MRQACCPHCQFDIHLAGAQAGEPVNCTRCGREFILPGVPGRRRAPRPAPRSQSAPRARLSGAVPDAEARGTGRVALVALGLAALLAGGAGVWVLAKQRPVPVPEERAVADTLKELPALPGAPVVVQSVPQLTPAGPKPPMGDRIYERLLRSVVYIPAVEQRGGERVATGGSGVLVDRDRALVLTNFHIVRDKTAVDVYFPSFDMAGGLITDPAQYAKGANLRVAGTVVATDPKRDLALLALERAKVPPRATGLPLAPAPAPTGMKVYSVGASGVRLPDSGGVLWQLSDSTVRGRSRDKFTLRDGQAVEAMLLETSTPANAGDSGGPTVNERCELVGLVSLAGAQSNQVRHDIDVTEVRGFLAGYAAKGGWAWPGVGTAPPTSSDGPEAVDRLAAQARENSAERRLEAALRLTSLGPDGRKALPALLGLLDDRDERVARAAIDAVAKVGPLAAEDQPAVEAALSGPGRNAKLFALRFYAEPKRPVPEAVVPGLVAALDHEAAEVRLAAVRAVANRGAASRPALLGPVLARTADDDPEVAECAHGVLKVLTPFTESDRPVLAGCLSHKKAELRLLALSALSDTRPDAASGVRWFRPRLDDDDPRVRVQSLVALAKLGSGAKDALLDVLGRTADRDPTVAVAAIAAVPPLGGGATAVKKLGTLLAPGTPAPVRQAAADALLALEPTDAASDLPALTALLGSDRPAARAAALSRIGHYGKDAAPALSALVARLSDDSAEVKLAALKAVGGIGTGAASAVPAVGKLLAEAEDETVQKGSVAALTKLGPKGVAPLARALGDKLPAATLRAVCEALGSFGPDAQPVGLALLNAATKQPDLAELALAGVAAVVQKNEAWKPDPVAAAAAKIGGDEVAQQLIERTGFTARIDSGVPVSKKAKYGEAVQFWAILTIGRLDPETLSPKVRAKVAEQLRYLAAHDPDKACKAAAKLGYALYPEPKK